MRTIVLVGGGLCTILGAVFILLKNKVEGLFWFGVPIQLLGMALVRMALRKPKTPEAEKPSPTQAVGVLVALGVILLLQFVYLIWWSNTNR